MGGDVDSTQVLCFDRLSSVARWVDREGNIKQTPSASSLMPALYVTPFSGRKAVVTFLKYHLIRGEKRLLKWHDCLTIELRTTFI